MVMMKRVPPSKQLNVRLTADDQAELATVMGLGYAWTPSDAVKRALIIAARTPAAEGFQILHAAMRERGAKRDEEERKQRQAQEAENGTMAELRTLVDVPLVERSVPDA